MEMKELSSHLKFPSQETGWLLKSFTKKEKNKWGKVSYGCKGNFLLKHPKIKMFRDTQNTHVQKVHKSTTQQGNIAEQLSICNHRQTYTDIHRWQTGHSRHKRKKEVVRTNP